MALYCAASRTSFATPGEFPEMGSMMQRTGAHGFGQRRLRNGGERVEAGNARGAGRCEAGHSAASRPAGEEGRHQSVDSSERVGSGASACCPEDRRLKPLLFCGRASVLVMLWHIILPLLQQDCPMAFRIRRRFQVLAPGSSLRRRVAYSLAIVRLILVPVIVLAVYS